MHPRIMDEKNNGRGPEKMKFYSGLLLTYSYKVYIVILYIGKNILPVRSKSSADIYQYP